jgi:dihydropteroate synthase
MNLKHARGELGLDHCVVMGIVNRTPDSFFDGGRMGLEETVEHAVALVEEGAGILDIGAVKAGPGEDVTEQEELERLVPVVQALGDATQVPLSVETGRPGVARAAFEAGAAIVNDVTALDDPALASACADAGAGLILMHHGGQLRGRPLHPRYDDIVTAVKTEWDRLVEVAVGSGVEREGIVLDPGLDFGKNTYHSLELMRRLPELVEGTLPVLVAASRKDIVGEALALQLEERLEGSLALVALSVAAGAAIVRVHDVRASVRTVQMVEAVLGVRPPQRPVRGLWE